MRVVLASAVLAALDILVPWVFIVASALGVVGGVVLVLVLMGAQLVTGLRNLGELVRLAGQGLRLEEGMGQALLSAQPVLRIIGEGLAEKVEAVRRHLELRH